MTAVKDNQVTRLYVDPLYHHMGLGRLLYQEAEQLVRDNGHETLLLGSMKSAVAFYQTMGLFVVEAKRCSQAMAGCECMLMKKVFSKTG
jgi:GNAT superfamily N-acetyltransferase